jgi:RNA polymerase-associated protein LEO1
MSDSEDPLDALDETAGDDLFGDEGDEGDDRPRAPRVLDDDDLASDPDEDPDSRRRDYGEDDLQPHETRDRVVMAVQTYRHQIPNPKDGNVRELFDCSWRAILGGKS